MPTGYTAPVQDGKITTAAEFLRNCIPAFDIESGRNGATIDPIEPDTSYHDERLAAARARLEAVRAWSDDDAAREAEAKYQRDVETMRDVAAKRRETLARYEEILAGVRAWVPPTPKHRAFHAFAVKQLEDSIEWDCSRSHYPKPVRVEGEDYRAAQIEQAERDIAYHVEGIDKVKARTAQRNAWVSAVLDTLPQGDMSHAG